MPKAKKTSAPSTLSNEELALKGMEFYNKKLAIKELETQCKEIRGPLEEAAKTSGAETDKGSKILVLPLADKEVHLKETLRVGKILLPEAIDILKENGLEECIENVPTIREDVLERMYDAGKVSEDVLKKIYSTKESYAFSVDVKDRFDV